MLTVVVTVIAAGAVVLSRFFFLLSGSGVVTEAAAPFPLPEEEVTAIERLVVEAAGVTLSGSVVTLTLEATTTTDPLLSAFFSGLGLLFSFFVFFSFFGFGDLV